MDINALDVHAMRLEYFTLAEMLKDHSTQHRETYGKMWELRVAMEKLGKCPIDVSEDMSYTDKPLRDCTNDSISFHAPSFVNVHQATLYHKSFGNQNDAFDIVFIHGESSNHMSWFQQIPMFSNTHRCIIYDQRGFGFSDTESLDKSERINDLLNILRHYNSKKCVIVAQSLGTMIAMQFARLYPYMVEGLCLISYTPWAFLIPHVTERLMYDVESSVCVENLKNVSDEFAYTNAVKNLWKNDLQPWFRVNHPDLSVLFDLTREITPCVHSLLKRPRVNCALSQYIASFSPTIKELSQWNIPTLLIAGCNDVLFDYMQQIPQYVNNSIHHFVNDCGHFAMYEKPEIVNSYIYDFVNKLSI